MKKNENCLSSANYETNSEVFEFYKFQTALLRKFIQILISCEASIEILLPEFLVAVSLLLNEKIRERTALPLSFKVLHE
jgi:hypothetical protein